MRVLFFINHDGFIRNFERVIHELAERGHTVHLAAAARRVTLMSDARSLEDLCASAPSVTFSRVPKERGATGPIERLKVLSASRSYLRFRGREYANAPKLRARADQYIPPAMNEFLNRPVMRSRPGRWALDRLFLHLIEELPTSSVLDDYIRRTDPDVVLVTPLVTMRAEGQVAALRSAQAAGIPTALLVHSWDNLTNKGLIHAMPDRVVVWNDAQKREATDLHRVPEEQVVVTGAHSYDHWFDWRPSTTREEFCRKVGLDPGEPFVVYMCSGPFIAPNEVPFIRQWITSLRSSRDERIRNLGVLIRPHPQNTEQWEGVRLDEFDRTALYPPVPAEWVGQGSRADYYDSIHHAAAVVGINTTAMIESAIQDRPVLTWLVPEFRDTQEGTLHFEHIASDEGVLLVARTFEEHEAQLAGVLASSSSLDRSRRFVERFVRPRGIDVPATPIVVDSIEALAQSAPRALRRPRPRWKAPLALRPFAPSLRRFVEAQARSADRPDKAARAKEKRQKSAPEKREPSARR
jgi:hypothetical protein